MLHKPCAYGSTQNSLQQPQLPIIDLQNMLAQVFALFAVLTRSNISSRLWLCRLAHKPRQALQQQQAATT
jgi:hypothetical protein